MVHSFIYDGDQNRDFISALGIRWSVPMREALYNRHVAFLVLMEGMERSGATFGRSSYT